MESQINMSCRYCSGTVQAGHVVNAKANFEPSKQIQNFLGKPVWLTKFKYPRMRIKFHQGFKKGYKSLQIWPPSWGQLEQHRPQMPGKQIYPCHKILQPFTRLLKFLDMGYETACFDRVDEILRRLLLPIFNCACRRQTIKCIVDLHS